MSGQAWHHPTPFEGHVAEAGESRAYIQRGTGNREAPCLRCEREGRAMAVIAPTPPTAGPSRGYRPGPNVALPPVRRNPGATRGPDN